MAGRAARTEDEDSNAYRFDELRPGRYIRVLHLQGATDKSQDLIGELEQINLDDENIPSYEALSWSWGDQSPEETLRIVKCRSTDKYRHLKITRNLASALKSLRGKETRRTLWVDAICINQNLYTERNHQVSQMGLVYGLSTNVCVWLDDNKPTGKNRHFDAGIAYDFIRNHVLDLWHFDEVCKEEVNSPNWVALLHLMTKPWFTRRWVIQEIALAPRATIHCGDYEMKWTEFADAVSLFVEAESATHRLSEVVKGDKRFNHIQGLFADVHTMGATMLVQMTSNLFQPTKEGHRKPLSTLEHLVSSLSMFDSKDVKDTIYALLAISKDATPEGDSHLGTDLRLQHNLALQKVVHGNRNFHDFSDEEKQKKINAAGRIAGVLASRLRFKPYEVAYQKPDLDVYQQFVEFCIRQSNSLDIICRPWAPQPQPESGSHSTTSDPSKSKATIRSRARLRSKISEKRDARMPVLPMPSWIADKKETAFVLTSHEVTRVKMERRNADPLVGLPGRKTYNASGDLGVQRHVPRFVKWDGSSYSLSVKGFVVDTVANTGLPAVLGNIPTGWLDFIDWDINSDESAPAAFCRTLVADKGPNGFNPPPFYSRACTEALRLMKGQVALDTRNAINEKQCTIVAQFLRRVREVIFNRRLMSTQGEVPKEEVTEEEPTKEHASDGNAGEKDNQPIEKDTHESVDGSTSENLAGDWVRTRNHSIGIVSQHAEPGDLICILYGCSVPVVLRRREKTTQEIQMEEENIRKSYPMKLFEAVNAIQKRVKTWKFLNRAMEEWEKDKPHKAEERKQKAKCKCRCEECQRCKAATRASSEDIPPQGREDGPSQNREDGPTQNRVEDANGTSQSSTEPVDDSARGDAEALNGGNDNYKRSSNTDAMINGSNEPAKKRRKVVHNGNTERNVDKNDEAKFDQRKIESEYDDMCRRWKEKIQSEDFKNSKQNDVQEKEIQAPKASRNPYYTVIGECYVDEMMSGEALEIRADKAIIDRVFELR